MAKKLTFESPNQTSMLLFIRNKRKKRKCSDFDDYHYIKAKQAYFEKYLEKTKITDQVILQLVNDLRIAKIEYKLQPRNRELCFCHLNNLHYIQYNEFGYFKIRSHFQSESFNLPIKITAQDSSDLINKMLKFKVVHFLTKKALLERRT